MTGNGTTYIKERTYRALGYDFRLRGDARRGLQLTHRYLAPFEVKGLSTRRTLTVTRSRGWGNFEVWRGRRMLGNPSSFGALLDYLLSFVNQEAIRRARRAFTVHAGAGSRNGAGIVLPAGMDSGKTTLMAGLVRAGFDYLSDEAAIYDPGTGLLQPYPKSLTLSQASMEALPGLERHLPPELAWGTRWQYHIRHEDLRPRSRGRPCPVRYVIAPKYRPGATTGLHPISRARAATILAQNSFNVRTFGRKVPEILGDMVAGAECFTLDVGDLGSAVRELVDLTA